ncbi:hypothetical protein [Streptomyces sp. NPDC006510]|uniref:hypothetical protein n=1 Tax=Streptomyces sp. NPDC006510 TaxID=3155600 RepID=UPI0033AF8E8D
MSTRRRCHADRAHDPTAGQNEFHRLARCPELQATVIDAFLGLAGTVITVCDL